MAHIPKTVPTVQIQGPGWEAHEHVMVKTYIGALERKAIGDAGVSVKQADGRTASAQINTADAARAKLRAGIVSWTITYEDGSALPFTDEGLEQLPEAYAAFILEELTRLWAAWDAPPIEPKTAGDAKRSQSFPVEQGSRRSVGRQAQA